MPAKTIDFRDIQGPVYTGRLRGEELRNQLGLDTEDATGTNIEVKIPSDTYTVSSSFFLGLFGPSVLKAGSKDCFLSRYKFNCPDYLKEAFDRYISFALQSKVL